MFTCVNEMARSKNKTSSSTAKQSRRPACLFTLYCRRNQLISSAPGWRRYPTLLSFSVGPELCHGTDTNNLPAYLLQLRDWELRERLAEEGGLALPPLVSRLLQRKLRQHQGRIVLGPHEEVAALSWIRTGRRGGVNDAMVLSYLGAKKSQLSTRLEGREGGVLDF